MNNMVHACEWFWKIRDDTTTMYRDNFSTETKCSDSNVIGARKRARSEIFNMKTCKKKKKKLVNA